MPDTSARDYAAPALAATLLVLLLVSVREILIPPLVLPLVLLGLWPLRQRTGVRSAMIAAVALTMIWVLRLYGGLLGPFVFALAIAYLVAPLVDRLERARFPRGLAVAVVTLPPLVAIVLVIALVGPQVWDQATALVANLPRFAQTLLAWMDAFRDKLERLPFLSREQRSWLAHLDAGQIAQFLQAHGEDILRQLGEWALALVQRVGTIVGFLAYLVITPVVAFYLLRDWKALLLYMEGLVPPARRPAMMGFLNEYDAALGRYVRGALIEGTIVGTLTFLGLLILGVPNALLLGLVAGVCNLIPYIGIAVSVVPALIVALTMPSAVDGLWRVGLVFLVVQFVDGSVTGPKIVGGSVGLHPVAIMLAMALGGAVLGFVGFLLAVPLAVLIKMIGVRAVQRYKASAYYGEVQAMEQP